MFRLIWIPTAVKFGVPETEFWKMNPKTFSRRLPYFEELQKHCRQELYNSAWLYGQYMHVAVVASLSKNVDYPDEPPELYPAEKEPEEIITNAVMEFKRMANAHNRSMDEKVEVSGDA